MTLQELVDNQHFFELWVLARYFYRIGEAPILSDAAYDNITKLMKAKCYDRAKDYLNRTYDDDPVPEAFLKLIGQEPVEFSNFQDRLQYAQMLDEDKSLSINSVTSFDEAFNYCIRM